MSIYGRSILESNNLNKKEEEIDNEIVIEIYCNFDLALLEDASVRETLTVTYKKNSYRIHVRNSTGATRGQENGKAQHGCSFKIITKTDGDITFAVNDREVYMIDGQSEKDKMTRKYGDVGIKFGTINQSTLLNLWDCTDSTKGYELINSLITKLK